MIIKGNVTTREVTVDGIALDPAPSQRLRNHSPDGYNWGFGGSGPAQLALAILLELTDKFTALKWYQEFKWKFIATLPKADFEYDSIDWIEWIEKKKEVVA